MAAAADDPARTWELAELRTRGAQVYAANCQACHQASGQGVAGSFPSLVGSPVALSPQKADIINLLLHGKNAMPAWASTLSDTEIAAVATYVENNFGNATGQVIQPAEVKAMRK
jgi:cytochrome c oxidase subunit 2